MSADSTDRPPQSADSPLSGTGTSTGRPDLGPHRDEGTPVTDAADSPADTKGPDLPALALARDEGHALTSETAPPAASEVTQFADQPRSAPGRADGNTTGRGGAKADGTMSLRERAEHIATPILLAGLALSASTADIGRSLDGLSGPAVRAAQAIGTVSDAVYQGGKIATEISGVANGDLNLPGTGGGTVEHLATESTPEVSVDEAPGPVGPDEPGSPVSDDIMTIIQIRGEEEKRNAEADKVALERRPPDRFPRAQNSPKKTDQVSDRRPTPTGRGQSRGRSK
jgi:hypothetical protein